MAAAIRNMSSARDMRRRACAADGLPPAFEAARRGRHDGRSGGAVRAAFMGEGSIAVGVDQPLGGAERPG